METAVHRNDKEDRLYIYVEGYVLPYLQEELQKVEAMRIYLYGRRAVNRYEIYGAGRAREIAQFGGYTLLEELECRAEAAELVFLLTQQEKRLEIRSYEVFYQRNEEMQNYLLEIQKADKSSGTSNLPEQKEEKRTEGKQEKTNGGWFTVQLTALFLLLTAIVITSTDSYDKLSQLGKSAKDVMFMVENRTAQAESAGQSEAASESETEQKPGASEEQSGQLEAASESETEQKPGASAEQSGQLEAASESETEQKPGASEEQSGQSEAASDSETEQKPGASEEQSGRLEAASDSETEQKLSATAEQSEAEEALSRNLTRYYEVKKGDTLYTICREVYGDLSKVRKVCELNHIENPDEICYGQKLVLP